MQESYGTFHSQEEMRAILKKKPEEKFHIFKPGEKVNVDGTSMIVCRTKNDRLILRGANAAETLKEKKIREEFSKEKTNL